MRVEPGGDFDHQNAEFIDPLGNPYHYAVSSAATPLRHGDYELVCYGSDNQAGFLSSPAGSGAIATPL